VQATLTLRELAGGGIVWDNHACMPLDTDCALMDSLAAVHDAGIDVLSLNVASGDQTAADALRMLAAFRSWIAARADKYLAVGSAADVRDQLRTVQAAGATYFELRFICHDVPSYLEMIERVASDVLPALRD